MLFMPERTNRPGTVRRLMVLLVLIGLAAGGRLLWYGQERGYAAIDPAPKTVERPVELAAMEITRIAPRRLTDSVRLSGSVRPYDQAVIKSEVAAKLTEVRVREGEAVKRGDLLAQFDTLDLKARLDEKLSNLAGAKAQLVLAEKTRTKNLALSRKQIVSESTLDEAQSTWQYNQAAVAALEAQVDMARKALADAEVRAPIDGIVAERTVNPGETLPRDTKLFTLVNLRRVEVEATIPAGEVARLKPGQPVVLRIEGFDDRTFQGVIDRINPMAVAGSRAIPVYVGIDNPRGELRGGMFATGEAIVAEARDAVALPAAALRRDGDGDDELESLDDHLVRRAVQPVAEWERGSLIQVSGLSPGAVVVSAVLPGLQAGQSVRLAGS
jgi:multidrug efflux system membrane fusion protein